MLNDIQFTTIEVLNGIPKITFQKTAKPVLNNNARIVMNCKENDRFKIGSGPNGIIYLLPTKETANTIKLSKMGNYLCFNNIDVFAKLGCKSYDVFRVESAIYKGLLIYKLQK